MGIDWEGMAEGYEGSVQDWYEDQIEKANKFEEMYRYDDDDHGYDDDNEEEEEEEAEKSEDVEKKDEKKPDPLDGFYGSLDDFEEVLSDDDLPF